MEPVYARVARDLEVVQTSVAELKNDPCDGTFWRRCECTASIHAAVYPVTVSRVAKRC
jgi:hypothetical protein